MNVNKLKEVSTGFKYCFQYLEEIENLYLGERFSFDDFERLNVLYDIKNLHENKDLDLINKLVCDTINCRDVFKHKEYIERLVSKQLATYREYNETIFLIDGEFPYYHLIEAIIHGIMIGMKDLEDPKTITSLTQIIDSKKPINKNKLPNFKTYFVFEVDNELFKELGVECVNLKVKQKDTAQRALEFLCDINKYRIGDSVGIMTSIWRCSKNGKKKWFRGEWNIVIEGNNKRTHYVDFDSPDNCIYMDAGFTGSNTSLYLSKNGKWKFEKHLQNLIK